MTGQESLSITGWIYLRSSERGQIFFDFGKNSKSHFFAALVGTEDKVGFQAQILTVSDKYNASSPAVEINKWNHLAVVFNAPAKTLSTYINGELAGETKDIEVESDQLFDNGSGGNNILYIGKSLASDNICLNAKLFDFRIYRIPLSERQITRIRFNPFRNREGSFQRRERPDPDLPEFPETRPQLYNEYLINVPDIQVEAAVGHLPRLPRYVPGVYSNYIEGPNVRVLWPAPTDNSQVLPLVHIQ
ncbi:MAG: LamG domain-containing protein [Bacteroidota bacterium]